mgnify:CR=1 FL=1
MRYDPWNNDDVKWFYDMKNKEKKWTILKPLAVYDYVYATEKRNKHNLKIRLFDTKEEAELAAEKISEFAIVKQFNNENPYR